MSERVAAIYIRVSTDAQAEEGYSIDAQKEQLTAYCVSKGIKNYDYYIDGGWSGSNIDRPEMKRLIEDAKANKLSHCIVYKLDRLSRNQKDTLYVIEDILLPNNVAFVSLTETFDTSTPTGRLMLGILSAFAQHERENIRMRTRMGMKERVKEGYWMGGGRVPFGYDYDKNQGILVPNKDAKKVKQIYQLYLDGYSCQNIANMLGLKYEKLALQILKRKCNYGVIEYNGEEYQGRHEPIITKETYDMAMAEMDKRSIKKFTASNHLLTGLCHCKRCGAKMRYQKWSNKGDKLVCYSQQNSKPYLVKDPNCDMDKVWAEEVEEIVLNEIFRLKINDIDNRNNEKTNSLLNTLQESKKTLESKIKKLYNLYAESDDDILLETITENKKQLSIVNKKIDKEIQHQNMLLSTNRLNDVIESLDEKWKYMTFDERQNIIRMLVSQVIIDKESVEVVLAF